MTACDPLLGVGEHERARGVDDVDALGAGIHHDPGLLGELLGRGLVAEHEEPDGLHAERAGRAEVLDRDVGLGAVGGDAGDRGAGRVGVLQVVHRAEAGEHEDGDLGLGGLVDGGRDELHLVDLGEAVVEARAAEAVAVRDLDDLHAGRVEGVHDAAHLLLGELVAHRVRAVAQRGVGDPQVALAAGLRGVGEHVGLGQLARRRRGRPRGGWSCHPCQTPAFCASAPAPTSGSGTSPSSADDFHVDATPSRWATMMSPTRAAAAVMMSRLPA